MPKGHPLTGCRNCGKPIRTRIELSDSGLCAECGPLIQNEQIAQLVEHRGPHFEHWQRQCARAFRWVNLDDERVSA